MTAVNPLALAARFGPWVLIAGLCVGVGVPSLAKALSPWIAQMVVLLLFLAVLRMDPGQLLGSLRDLPRVLFAVICLQLFVPLLLVFVATGLGLAAMPVALALILMASAPSIVGSPNFCIMIGLPSSYAMRMMVSGTALLPLTVVPVFWLIPALGGPDVIITAALKLFGTIVVTACLALALRKTVLAGPTRQTLINLEGASALMLAVFVVGLMPAVSAAFRTDPAGAFGWLALAFFANFGLQFLSFVLLRARNSTEVAAAVSMIAGNRNIALFFVALPQDVTAQVMVFIGCYQIPMYLTPLVMKRIYAKRLAR